ncbi:MAG: hypothetical protein CMJ85_14745 [Planctomycetes bacterium]|nr:hypothetical protein [Planctomycetota bacterium]
MLGDLATVATFTVTFLPTFFFAADCPALPLRAILLPLAAALVLLGLAVFLAVFLTAFFPTRLAGLLAFALGLALALALAFALALALADPAAAGFFLAAGLAVDRDLLTFFFERLAANGDLPLRSGLLGFG